MDYLTDSGADSSSRFHFRDRQTGTQTNSGTQLKALRNPAMADVSNEILIWLVFEFRLRTMDRCAAEMSDVDTTVAMTLNRSAAVEISLLLSITVQRFIFPIM